MYIFNISFYFIMMLFFMEYLKNVQFKTFKLQMDILKWSLLSENSQITNSQKTHKCYKKKLKHFWKMLKKN